MNAKAVCVFPLGRDELPRTGGQLTQSMLDGWRGVFAIRDPANVVDLAGGRYPAVDEMNVDLTGAVANPKRKKVTIPDPVPASRSLAVRQFTMVAEPLVTHRANVNLKVTGTGVRFDLQHDKEGRPMLMLADAREGTLHFDATHADVERLLLTHAKAAGAARAVAVRSVDLHLQSINARSVRADLHVSTRIAFVPAGLRFTARVDIDDRMNARISDLRCDGDEVLGPLIVGLIRPALSKYDGHTKPLLAFPTGNLKLRDVAVRTGERVELTATFGN
jgi:hypothetical protein